PARAAEPRHRLEASALGQPRLLDRDACAALFEEARLPAAHGVELRRPAEQREPLVPEVEEVLRGEAAGVAVAHEHVPAATGMAPAEEDAPHDPGRRAL